jgi:hypothetical protein
MGKGGARRSGGWTLSNEPYAVVRLLSTLIMVFAFLTFGLGGASYTYIGYSQVAVGSWWAGLACSIVAILAVFTFNRMVIAVNCVLGILAVGCCIGGAVVDGAYSTWFGGFKACTMNMNASPYQIFTWDAGDVDNLAREASKSRAFLEPATYETCFCAGKDGLGIGKVRVLYNSCYMIIKYSSRVLAASSAMTAICGLLTLSLCCYEVHCLVNGKKKRQFVAVDLGLHVPINDDSTEDPVAF